MAAIAAPFRVTASNAEPDVEKIMRDPLLLEEVFRQGATRIPYFSLETRRAILAACQRAAPDDLPETEFHLMTPQQQDIIRLLASGKTSKDVANSHNVNPRQIDRWIYKLRHKHNLPNRTALFNYYRHAMTKAEES